MATRRSEFAVPVAEFAAALLARPEVGPRCQVMAEQVAQLLPGAAVVVYVIEDQEDPSWAPKATSGEITVAGGMEFESGTLGTVAESREFTEFDASDLAREEYAHLDIRRTIASLAYMPLLMGETLLGAIEVISYEEAFPEETQEGLDEIAQLAAPALAAAVSYESERNTSLHSISRVAQMYDLEKVFNSTLEMNELLPTIAKKFQEVMNVQAINLWMVNNDALELVSSEGLDPTVAVGQVQGPGEGVAGDISDNGEPVLITDPDDERLK
ncbi:MAG: GAF domain-containing protein, partial [Candidatus Sulfotelmatobacter sp.]